jgi:predicted RNase H-like nuclease (RuvC/YqgF family)
MTQEELDALLNSGENLDLGDENFEENDNSAADEVSGVDNNLDGDDDPVMPPPADEKHKVVAQLDEVTKESEEKASQVLEIISEISEDVEKLTSKLNDVKSFLDKEKTIFEKLHEKFPHIKTFENEIKEVLENSEEMENKLFTALEIMQYQDIHRQKIERVINIMRALIKYMNKLFEGKIDDKERVQSADYIHGDSDEIVTEDEIEKLLQEFGG